MSKVCGVMMVKDEADVVWGTVVHHMEEGLDFMVVADNGSTDGTRDILSDLCNMYPQLTVVDDKEVGYYQSRKMTELASDVAGNDTPWIIPIDADELWFSHEGKLADYLRTLNGVNVVRSPLFNHFCSSIDEKVDNPFERIVFRQNERGALPKVCFRWSPDATIQQGNHGVTFTNTTPLVLADDRTLVELRHFPYRSPEQFIHKAENGAKAYAATNLPVTEGAHWRGYGEILERHGRDALLEVFYQWFHFLSPVDAGMVRDPAPYRRWNH